MTEKSALRALEVASSHLKLLEEQTKAARAKLYRAKMAYAKARPLTPIEHAKLLSHFKNGEGLCCNSGLQWLRSFLPEPWAIALNDWAYDATGCRGLTSDIRGLYYRRIIDLKLDCFPGLDDS